MSTMPKLPTDVMCKGLSEEEAKLIRAAFSTRGDKALRTAKPFARVGREDTPENQFRGRANYVWRMLCFDYVPYHPHCCMPMTADWDIPGNYDSRRAVTKELDDIIKRAESNLPITLQRGAMAWGKALGYV